MREYIKASDYAKKEGIHYRTAVKHFYKGYVEGYKDENTKRIYIKNPDYKYVDNENNQEKVILYARVSSTTNKASLDGQLERMRNFAAAKGYQVIGEITEIASGLNDSRPKLNKILERTDWSILLVEHKDRLTRFGFNYFKFLEKFGQKVEAINTTDNKDKELVDDFVSVITSFCGRIYGSNRKKKTNEIIKNIKEEVDES